MISQPKAPDPYATAAAQGTINKQTAISQQLLNSVDQTTPDGSLTYSENGAWSDGTPRLGVTQTLSPSNQYLYDTNQGTQKNLADIGQQQSGQIGKLLATPFDMSQGAINAQTAGMPALPQYRAAPTPGAQPTSWGADPAMSGLIGTGVNRVNDAAYATSNAVPGLRVTDTPGVVDARYDPSPTQVGIRQIGSNDALEDQLYGAAFQRYQPQLDRQQQDLETSLANKGLTPGSTGYDNAMRDFGQGVNDLRTQTFLKGQDQAFGQSAQRAQNDFQQDLASNGQYWNQWDTKNQHDFGQDLQRTNQDFQQRLAADGQAYGQELQSANYSDQQLNNRFNRLTGALTASLGAQGQDYSQRQGNEENAFQEGMTAAQYGSAQDQYAYGAASAQRQQALSELLQQRQEPMNEIASLMGGSQVSKPQWTATPQTSIQPADLTGMVKSNYQTAMQGYTGMLGGLASLGGTAATAAFKYSDERLKEDVEKVGEDPDTGLGLYTYRYRPETGLGGGLMQLGLMAQEVEKKNPAAVARDAQGYRMVDYGRALEGAR